MRYNNFEEKMSENPMNTLEVSDGVKAEQIDTKPVATAEEKPILAIVIAALLLVGLIVGLFFLARAEGQVVSQVRDIFIILMALMMFVIGVALVVLIIQLANLTNLLQHEIKPILNSTTDTVNTLKGTVRFLSDNVSEPVIKLNESLASIKKLVDIFRLKR
jgi:predicted PurR-regulated permease PerM